MNTDVTLHDAMENIAHLSARHKRNQFLGGYDTYRGYDLNIVAQTLCAAYMDADYSEVVKGLEDLEDHFLEVLEGDPPF